jgi:hypothetical protein
LKGGGGPRSSYAPAGGLQISIAVLLEELTTVQHRGHGRTQQELLGVDHLGMEHCTWQEAEDGSPCKPEHTLVLRRADPGELQREPTVAAAMMHISLAASSHTVLELRNHAGKVLHERHSLEDPGMVEGDLVDLAYERVHLRVNCQSEPVTLDDHIGQEPVEAEKVVGRHVCHQKEPREEALGSVRLVLRGDRGLEVRSWVLDKNALTTYLSRLTSG